MGAYYVRGGKLFGFVADKRRTEAFLALLDHVDPCYPEREGHLVCDNPAEHVGDEVADWLEEHPRWTLHTTPKHASWLNQIGCAFSLVEEPDSKASLTLVNECYGYFFFAPGDSP